MTRRELAARIEHTLLAPGATGAEVVRLCEEARAHGFRAVCVSPVYVELAAARLAGSGVGVCTVIGFPLGTSTPGVKMAEAREAIASGAGELDVVPHLGALKEGDDTRFAREVAGLVEAAAGRVVKVILEVGLLTREETARGARLAVAAGAGFVKTSTGYGPRGATVADVRLLREAVGSRAGVKAAGGIRDYATAVALLGAGADRLGISQSLAVLAGAPGEPPGGDWP